MLARNTAENQPAGFPIIGAAIIGGGRCLIILAHVLVRLVLQACHVRGLVLSSSMSACLDKGLLVIGDAVVGCG